MTKKTLHLNVFLMATGNHEASWRLPESNPQAETDIDRYISLAQTAEKGGFDSIFFADGSSLRAEVGRRPAGNLEPLTLLAALAVATEAARNFGLDELPAHKTRYECAEEFLDVVQGLWQSWDVDAILADKEAGAWADDSKVHALSHEGRFFKVAGPLNVPRSPQVYPLGVQAGSSDSGKELARKFAEAVFTAHQNLEEALAKDEELNQLIRPEYALAQLAQTLRIPPDELQLDRQLPNDLPDEDEIEGAKSRHTLIVDLAKREALTVRELIGRLGGGRGHRTFAGTPEQVADAIEEWFNAGAADDSAVVAKGA